ncbi:MAG: hypothetical protein LUC93_11200 [Planctomycetaceae bacterium]|nr:hypothetical protein [Planctomycetaceae bacterium]
MVPAAISPPRFAETHCETFVAEISVRVRQPQASAKRWTLLTDCLIWSAQLSFASIDTFQSATWWARDFPAAARWPVMIPHFANASRTATGQDSRKRDSSASGPAPAMRRETSRLIWRSSSILAERSEKAARRRVTPSWSVNSTVHVASARAFPFLPARFRRNTLMA